MEYEQSRAVARAENAMLENTVHGNIRTANAIEKLFDNFDRIPISVLEKFVVAFDPDQDCKKQRIFTREEVEKTIEDILESPDVIFESSINEHTNHDAESLLETFELQK
jgi:hypothetical protein